MTPESVWRVYEVPVSTEIPCVAGFSVAVVRGPLTAEDLRRIVGDPLEEVS